MPAFDVERDVLSLPLYWAAQQTLTAVSGDTLYYADNDQVSATSSQGTLTAGQSATFTEQIWVVSASRTSVLVTYQGTGAVVTDTAASPARLNTTGAGDGQALSFDQASTTWKPATVSGGGVDASLPSSALTRYVSPTGSNANNGLTPKAPFQTIAAAYNDLVTEATAAYTGVNSPAELGVGRIYLLPGDHDVGAGLLMDYKYPVEIIGFRAGRHSHFMPNSASRVKSSSSTATYFFRMHGTNVGYGWVFRDIAFLIDQTVNTSLTSIINPDSIDDWVVDNCSADTVDNTTNTSVWLVKHDNTLTAPTGDAAWFRLTNNRYSRVSLYYGSGSTNVGNYNKFTIERNVGFYGGANAHVQFAGNISGGNIANNDFEGTAVGIYQSAGTVQSCTFIDNSGEDDTSGTPANPFYNFAGSCSQMIIVGGAVSAPNATSGVFAQFGTNAYNNLVIGPFDANAHAGMKRQIVDSSTYGNRIMSTSFGEIQKVKSGASTPTIADTDFAPTPQDGTTAVTVNTTSGEVRLYLRANGSWSFLSTVAAGGSSPLTTKGDLYGYDTAPDRLPVGGSLTDRIVADSSVALGVKWVPHCIARTADGTAIVSNVTLASDSVLVLPVAASEVWFVQAWILFFTANATMDAKFGFAGPTGMTAMWGFGGAAGSSAIGYGDWPVASSATGAMLGLAGNVSVGGVNGGTSGTMLSGVFTNSTTAGSLAVQAAQNTSDAGNLIVKAGSLLLCWRIV